MQAIKAQGNEADRKHNLVTQTLQQHRETQTAILDYLKTHEQAAQDIRHNKQAHVQDMVHTQQKHKQTLTLAAQKARQEKKKAAATPSK